MLRFFRKQYRHCICSSKSVIHPEAIIEDGNGKDSIVIGENTHVRGRVVTFSYGGKVVLGDWCYLGENSNIWSSSLIKIGCNVLIAHNVSIFDDNTHPVEYMKRREHIKAIYEGTCFNNEGNCLKSKAVIINDDAWICCNSVILKGVHIGKGAVVAAGSIVTKDVPDFTLVAGNPARVIKYLDIV